MRDYDVARHQPHPPGYPVFIGLAKPVVAAFSSAGVAQPELVALSSLSATFGAVLLVAVYSFARSLFEDDELAFAAAVLLAVAPIFWFTALRPLSDVAGLALAFVSLAAVTAAVRHRHSTDAWNRRRVWTLVSGFAVAGFAAGCRSQMAILTFPLLAFVLVAVRMPFGVRARAALAIALAMLAWGVPLVMVSGGLGDYLEALGGQAGEDFSGAVMVWTHRTLRAAASAVLNTFVRPWDSPALAGMMISLAAAGLLVAARRNFRATAILLLLVCGPYLAFHLLFQETEMIRYALPLVPIVSILAAAVFSQARRVAGVPALAVIVIWSASLAVPAGRAFGQVSSPIFSAFDEMRLLPARGDPPLIGMHRRIWSESRRARQWTGFSIGRLLEAPRDYEVFELTRAWREGSDNETWFLADPRRTDLALIDSEYRRTREYRWPFDAHIYVGGARPGQVDWHIYSKHGWFLEQGWALTPEIGGITERDGWGPHRRPSLGWIRRTSGAKRLMIGGRHLGAAGEPPVRITVRIDDRPVLTFESGPGFFLHFADVPAEALAGSGRHARLTVVAAAVSGGTSPRVALEQFNLQAPDVVQFGFSDGWYEPEYNPRDARSWRWMSDAAALQVWSGGSDVTIEIRGESPLRYYDDPPTLRVAAGDRVLGELVPDEDFTMAVTASAEALSNSDGRVVLRSSGSFVPAERGENADPRRLGLRIYSVSVTKTSR